MTTTHIGQRAAATVFLALLLCSGAARAGEPCDLVPGETRPMDSLVCDALQTTMDVRIEGAKVFTNVRIKNISPRTLRVEMVFNDKFSVQQVGGDYLQKFGPIVGRGPFTRESFRPLEPGETREYRDMFLGPRTISTGQEYYDYAFLPGTHQYRITPLIEVWNDERNGRREFHGETISFTLTLPEKQ
ncbi:MAG: hypothetical protein V4505_02885 [Pseudomonadota bacterium]